MAEKKFTIEADGQAIEVLNYSNEDDFLSLTDIAKRKSDEPSDVIKNWLRNRNTIEFLGLWEKFHNPNFNSVDFDLIKNRAGSNSFTMSPKKWISSTNAIGIKAKGGRYGGAYAHKDIAFEFASWISPEFKLYIIKDYQRLRIDEADRMSLEWNVRRELTKTNYTIHTDAIKEKLIHEGLTPGQIRFHYSNEADLLNVALFGMTAKEWKSNNPNQKGNMRDNASTVELIILSNLENLNSEYIHADIPMSKRLEMLRAAAIRQLASYQNSTSIKKLK